MNIPAHVHAGAYAPGTPASMQGQGAPLAAWYHGFVVAVIAAVIYTNLPVYAFVRNAGLLPKYFFFAMMVLMAPLAVAKHRQLAAYLLSPFALWASLLLLLNLIHLSSMSAGGELAGSFLADVTMQSRRALIETRIQYLLFAMVVGFVVFASVGKRWLRPMAVLAVLVPCAVLADFLLPGTFYPLDTPGVVLGRAAATFINPTMAGEVLLHVFLLACVVTPARYRGPLFLLAGAAILTTFSRAAILAWSVMFVILVASKALPRSAVAMTVLALGAVVLGMGVFESYLLSRSDFDGAADNILARLDFFSSLSVGDDSAVERAAVFKAGCELFLENPLFGAGAGATLFWSLRGSTHNQLLLFAAEYGVLGVGLWVWMVVILWRGRLFAERGLQVAMVFLFVFMSMFTHLMVDVETYWLVSFALASVGRAPGAAARQAKTARSTGRRAVATAEQAPFAWSYAAIEAQGRQDRMVR
ncbi:MAG: O-antigen ligase domain-containing protein [Lysobacteraceae bacterium]|nr:MAG: O-antigen ligase domain-containing protein [Xanthomonadaceae bacterium]